MVGEVLFGKFVEFAAQKHIDVNTGRQKSNIFRRTLQEKGLGLFARFLPVHIGYIRAASEYILASAQRVLLGPGLVVGNFRFILFHIAQ